jgi:hypothetical protein
VVALAKFYSWAFSWPHLVNQGHTAGKGQRWDPNLCHSGLETLHLPGGIANLSQESQISLCISFRVTWKLLPNCSAFSNFEEVSLSVHLLHDLH